MYTRFAKWDVNPAQCIRKACNALQYCGDRRYIFNEVRNQERKRKTIRPSTIVDISKDEIDAFSSEISRSNLVKLPSPLKESVSSVIEGNIHFA
jgi:hypothetical protein